MNLREVREKVELLHDWYCTNPVKYEDGKAKHPWEDHLNDFDVTDAVANSVKPIANYILAIIDPEPESATGCGRCTSNQEQGTGVMK